MVWSFYKNFRELRGFRGSTLFVITRLVRVIHCAVGMDTPNESGYDGRDEAKERRYNGTYQALMHKVLLKASYFHIRSLQ